MTEPTKGRWRVRHSDGHGYTVFVVPEDRFGEIVIAETGQDNVADAVLIGRAKDLRKKLIEATDEWPQFDGDEPVNGADLVEWFGIWRQQVNLLLDRLGSDLDVED